MSYITKQYDKVFMKNMTVSDCVETILKLLDVAVSLHLFSSKYEKSLAHKSYTHNTIFN